MRLMTYNVEYSNPEPASAIDAIESADTDVVLLQEITSGWERRLVDRLATRYPHRVFRLHARASGGLAVLSKVPIVTEEVLEAPLRGWFFAERIVLDAGFPLQILHVHLRPAIEDGSWLKGFFSTPVLRRREIETFWRAMAALPTIVAGDFNEDATGLAVGFLEQHGLARALTSGPTTWHYEVMVNEQATDLLKMDIDHVMFDPALVVRDAYVMDAGRSDHRPVIVTVEPSA